MKILNPKASCRLYKLTYSLPFICLLFLNPSISHAAIITDLLITEIMANPNAVSDRNGEWFEIFNPTTEAFNLNKITISDNGSNEHLIDLSTELLIQSGEYFVFGKNGNQTVNGGYTADYIYNSFTLSNSIDEIILTDLSGNYLSLEYGKGFTTPGHSTELISPDMLLTNYSTTTAYTYGLGDFGTPGEQGTFQFKISNVPEPSTLLLLMTGLIGLRTYSKRKNLT